MTSPNKNKRCECKLNAVLLPDMASWYDEETELPFVNHKPNECRCLNKLKQYMLNGKRVWLCSNCTGQGETEL